MTKAVKFQPHDPTREKNPFNKNRGTVTDITGSPQL